MGHAVSSSRRPNNQKCVSLSSHGTKKLQGYIHRWTSYRDALKSIFLNFLSKYRNFQSSISLRDATTIHMYMYIVCWLMTNPSHHWPTISHTPPVSSNLPINLGDGQQLYIHCTCTYRTVQSKTSGNYRGGTVTLYSCPSPSVAS